MASTGVEPVQLVAQEVVRLGWTIHETKSRPDVQALAGGLGLAGLSTADHRLVRDRLKRATVRAAGVREFCKRKGCNAPIRWVLTGAHDRQMPIDPLPHRAGNVVLHRVPGLIRPRAEVLGHVDDASPWPRYRPHFATCPDQQRVPVGPTREEEAEVAAERAEHPMFVALTIRSTTWCLVGDCDWRHTGPASDAKAVGKPGHTTSEVKNFEHYTEHHLKEQA